MVKSESGWIGKHSVIIFFQRCLIFPIQSPFIAQEESLVEYYFRYLLIVGMACDNISSADED